MPEPEGVSEQAMGAAVEEAALHIAGYYDSQDMLDAPSERDARMILEAALPVLLASGELVKGETLGRGFTAKLHRVEDARDDLDRLCTEWRERAVRAERALADCKEALEEIATNRHSYARPAGRIARSCLARLGSEADPDEAEKTLLDCKEALEQIEACNRSRPCAACRDVARDALARLESPPLKGDHP